MRTVTDQIRGGVMWFAVLLVVVTAMFTVVVAGGRIDSPEEFVMSLRGDRMWAIPLAFASFLLIAALPRPAISKRAVLAILFGVACWFLVWRWLVHADYAQLRARGVDPEQVLQSARAR